jgi:nitrile hydratase
MADHDHDDHDHGSELSEPQLRVRALETVLAEKGYLDPAVLDLIVEHYETKVGPHNGARVVAKAWADPEFKRALVEDATKAVGALGLISRVGDHLIAVENTPQRHNMIVCCHGNASLPRIVSSFGEWPSILRTGSEVEAGACDLAAACALWG